MTWLDKIDPNAAIAFLTLIAGWWFKARADTAKAAMQRRVSAAIGEARSVIASIVDTADADMTPKRLEQQIKGAIDIQLTKLELDPESDDEALKGRVREAIAAGIAAWVAKHPEPRTLVMPAVARQG